MSKLHGVPVWQHLNTVFDAAVLVKTDRYERGTVLHTAHARLWTNATIMRTDGKDRFQVLTDIGNYMDLTRSDLQTMYLPPDRRRVTTTELENLDWSKVL